MIGGFNVACRQRARRGDDFGIEVFTTVKRLGRRQTRAGGGISVFDQIEPDKAGLLLEHERFGQRAAGFVCSHGEDIGGADIGMTGERQLSARREDAHLRGVRTILGRQYEGGLGDVEFAGDGLHLRAGQVPPVRDDRELIAAEFAVGKDVDGDKRNLHSL